MGIEPTWDFVEPHAGFEDQERHQVAPHLRRMVGASSNFWWADSFEHFAHTAKVEKAKGRMLKRRVAELRFLNFSLISISGFARPARPARNLPRQFDDLSLPGAARATRAHPTPIWILRIFPSTVRQEKKPGWRFSNC